MLSYQTEYMNKDSNQRNWKLRGAVFLTIATVTFLWNSKFTKIGINLYQSILVSLLLTWLLVYIKALFTARIRKAKGCINRGNNIWEHDYVFKSSTLGYHDNKEINHRVSYECKNCRKVYVENEVKYLR